MYVARFKRKTLAMHEYIKSIREKVGNEKLLVPATACIVLNEREEVLLQLRSDTRHWGCPGGIMDIGETAVESVRREVMEETGLTITDPWLFGVYSGNRYEGRYPNGDEIAVVQLAFVAEDFEGDPAGDHESVALDFFPLGRLPEPIVPHHHEFLIHFREYLGGQRTIPYVK
jgi:8-oxo-dGTP pyrophosphatase MutT (NUDIX family)